uniref:Uncharacterized protein n=1 Tax=Rangifer tarandus platyrhynchus TaxID=3082113 RepID=A0ACB0E4U4_RANTA|nr:unnamed protein product [Rangifer tarandus platyrhynchus]
MGEGSRSRAVPGAGAAGPSALLSLRQTPNRSSACPLEADTGLHPRDCASVPDAGGLRPGDSAPLRPPRPPALAGPALPATHHSGRLRLASQELSDGKRCRWEPPTPPHSGHHSRLSRFAPEAWDSPELTEKHFRERRERRNAVKARAAEARGSKTPFGASVQIHLSNVFTLEHLPRLFQISLTVSFRDSLGGWGPLLLLPTLPSMQAELPASTEAAEDAGGSRPHFRSGTRPSPLTS